MNKEGKERETEGEREREKDVNLNGGTRRCQWTATNLSFPYIFIGWWGQWRPKCMCTYAGTLYLSTTINDTIHMYVYIEMRVNERVWSELSWCVRPADSRPYDSNENLAFACRRCQYACALRCPSSSCIAASPSSRFRGPITPFSPLPACDCPLGVAASSGALQASPSSRLKRVTCFEKRASILTRSWITKPVVEKTRSDSFPPNC